MQDCAAISAIDQKSTTLAYVPEVTVTPSPLAQTTFANLLLYCEVYFVFFDFLSFTVFDLQCFILLYNICICHLFNKEISIAEFLFGAYFTLRWSKRTITTKSSKNAASKKHCFVCFYNNVETYTCFSFRLCVVLHSITNLHNCFFCLRMIV